ncbi:DUF2252 domain-containing protein [Nocardia sp. XZ_19_385]|uniref:DUF2252 domain-containing protein n=1 Tax=Nocardia sp. XZ_19_385 TaxID=2769488 RepID=UPI00188F700E|nr:DUF2252 domain-containing protein [Nocardia sp. XZ_19_385]
MTSATITRADHSAAADGRAERKQVPRSAHAEWRTPKRRGNPVAILEKQAKTRVPDLVPIRYARMATGPFPFYRGAPAIMAADLAAGPRTDLVVQLCGDAHLSNFGLFASPERQLVFDVNDFDETLPGPFEWDVKRLAASVVVATRANGGTDTEAQAAALAGVRGYREAMRRLAELDAMTVWYERTDAQMVEDLMHTVQFRKGAAKMIADARARTSAQALHKLTEPGPDGMPRIRNRDPFVVETTDAEKTGIDVAYLDYRRTIAEERRPLLHRYRLVDSARKVVGVGSVGTRCYILLLEDLYTGSPLFLQAKQAEASILAPYLKPSRYRHQGHRVVYGQRLMQATSDIFLGWASALEKRHYYVRQLRDMKGSVVLEEMPVPVLTAYAELCGATLARAHARSGDRVAIAAYLGGGDVFDNAIAEFALAYADQTLADHQTMLDAIESGRIKAAPKAY